MARLTDNADLYAYLLRLAEVARGSGADGTADGLQFAARQSTGLSTEFLGESLIALKNFARTTSEILDGNEKAELESAIKQVEFALNRPNVGPSQR